MDMPIQPASVFLEAPSCWTSL